jgi:hypothetical protein
MAEPTLYEPLGGIASAAVVDNFSDRLTAGAQLGRGRHRPVPGLAAISGCVT